MIFFFLSDVAYPSQLFKSHPFIWFYSNQIIDVCLFALKYLIFVGKYLNWFGMIFSTRMHMLRIRLPRKERQVETGRVREKENFREFWILHPGSAYFFKGIVHTKSDDCWKCTHPQAIRFVSSSEIRLKKFSITSLVSSAVLSQWE